MRHRKVVYLSSSYIILYVIEIKPTLVALPLGHVGARIIFKVQKVEPSVVQLRRVESLPLSTARPPVPAQRVLPRASPRRRRLLF